jgi:phosphate transport system substrate-binding protein
MRTSSRAAAIATGCVISTLALPSQVLAQDVWLQGAGATFPAPLYEMWIEHYRQDHPDLTITYDAVGSGEGISRFITGSVDFGASDAALSDQQIEQVPRGVELIPATARMIVLAYNLEGLNGDLRLKRNVYADILLGAITRWNDARIQESNPDLALPDKTIAIVARLDGSGTTYALTNHLSAISETWRDGPGRGTRIDWPGSAMLARGNEGVAARIEISDGSIGYVEYGFANRLGLPMAALQNKAGEFVKPDPSSGQQAMSADGEPLPEDLRRFVVDPAGAGSYPIVTYSWLLLYKDYPQPEKSLALRDFIGWGLTEGQAYATELGYIPLSQSVAGHALQALQAIK